MEDSFIVIKQGNKNVPLHPMKPFDEIITGPNRAKKRYLDVSNANLVVIDEDDKLIDKKSKMHSTTIQLLEKNLPQNAQFAYLSSQFQHTYIDIYFFAKSLFIASTAGDSIITIKNSAIRA